MLKRALLMIIALMLLAPSLCTAKKYLILYNDQSRASIRLTESYAGPRAAADQLSRSFKAVVNMDTVVTNQRPNPISGYLTDGYDLIIGLGHEVAETVYTSAINNKYQQYALIGITRANLPDNAVGFTFSHAEGGYLAGYLAASVSQTGKIGFIGGERSNIIMDFARGFRDGARLANPDIKIDRIYLSDFYDELTARNRADEIYRAGADVIFHAAGMSGRGVIESAVNAKALAIGVSGSYGDLASVTIANVVLDYNHAIFKACQMIEEGRFQGGVNTLLNLRNVGMGFNISNNPVISNDLRRALEMLKSDIIKGNVTVRNNSNKRVN